MQTLDNNTKEAVSRLERMSKGFGGLVALSEVDLSVKESRIMELIGPNGVGKITLFNVAISFYKPEMGDIYIRGEKNYREVFTSYMSLGHCQDIAVG